jgi:biopolymer transport protein ExbB
MLPTFFLQAATNLESIVNPTTTETVTETSILDLLMNGGPVMIPLGILLFITIYLLIERYLTISKASKIDPAFMKNIRDYVVNGNLEAAKTLAKTSQTPLARLIEKGVLRIGRPLEDIRTSIENTGKIEVAKMEKGLAALATIAGAAPMLGFLGTVAGMINAFRAIAAAESAVTPSLLAGGIYEAMITTLAGLVVGLLAYLGYNSLTVMVENIVYKMEASSVEFIDLLQEPA